MTFPTIHMNGTSAKSLMEDIDHAYHAINAAMDALRRMSPNGRDYYPQPGDALGAAMREHQARSLKLQSVKDELESLSHYIADMEHEQTRKR